MIILLIQTELVLHITSDTKREKNKQGTINDAIRDLNT